MTAIEPLLLERLELDAAAVAELQPASRATMLLRIHDLLGQLQAQLYSIDRMSERLDDSAEEAFHLALNAASEQLAKVDEQLDILGALDADKAAMS